MELSKCGSKESRWIKCTYKECNNKIFGAPNTRFCEYHKDIRNRDEIKNAKLEDVMKVIPDRFSSPTQIELDCELCGIPYRLILYPLQQKYPRFCEPHRNQYKRDNYRKLKGDNCGTSDEQETEEL